MAYPLGKVSLATPICLFSFLTQTHKKIEKTTHFGILQKHLKSPSQKCWDLEGAGPRCATNWANDISTEIFTQWHYGTVNGPVRWLPNGFIAKTWFWFFCDFLSVSMLNILILIYTDQFWFVSVWSEISLNIPAFLSGWTSIHVRLFAHWKPEKQTLQPEILGAVGVVHAVAMGYELIIGVSFQWVITSWEFLMGDDFLNSISETIDQWIGLWTQHEMTRSGPEPPRHFGANHVANPTICQPD